MSSMWEKRSFCTSQLRFSPETPCSLSSPMDVVVEHFHSQLSEADLGCAMWDLEPILVRDGYFNLSAWTVQDLNQLISYLQTEVCMYEYSHFVKGITYVNALARLQAQLLFMIFIINK
jgi:hypothetical protein